MGLEMFEQAFSGIGFVEDPALHSIGIEAVAELLFECFLVAALEDHFSRLEGLQEFVDILLVAFSHKEFAGGDIQEGNTTLVFGVVDTGQEIIAVMLQHFIVSGDTRRYQFSYAAFHDAFGKFGIFELIADGHAVTCFHQFMEIGVQGMMGEACQFGGSGIAIIPFGKGNAQHLGSHNGVAAKGFIEIAYTEE